MVPSNSLPRPLRDEELLDAVQLGLARDRARRQSEMALTALRERFESLKPQGTRDHDSGRPRSP